jgi:protoporphyrinogen/coproporphyrinogen III oxidase
MSVRAVLPRFAEMERESGSLVRASLKARRARGKNAGPAQPLFTSLKMGVQQMVDAAVTTLTPSCLRLRQEHVGVRPINEDWQVESAGVSEKFQAVVMAVPASAAPALLRQVHPGLIEGLGKIQYTSSAAVALGFNKAVLPPGHGFLVPRTEGRKLLACTFVHKKFNHRAPDGQMLLRCFISSSRVPDLNSLSDEHLIQSCRAELKDILGLTAEPIFAEVFRWNPALPQYEVGHLERVALMKAILDGMPNFYLAGNSFDGIGIPDCIRSGRVAAEKILRS